MFFSNPENKKQEKKRISGKRAKKKNQLKIQFFENSKKERNTQ